MVEPSGEMSPLNRGGSNSIDKVRAEMNSAMNQMEAKIENLQDELADLGKTVVKNEFSLLDKSDHSVIENQEVYLI